MPPSEFYGSDTWTVMDAYDGYAISKGVKKTESRPWTKEDVDEIDRMMKEDEERMARARDGHR
jgi:hypothetical protein